MTDPRVLSRFLFVMLSIYEALEPDGVVHKTEKIKRIFSPSTCHDFSHKAIKKKRKPFSTCLDTCRRILLLSSRQKLLKNRPNRHLRYRFWQTTSYLNDKTYLPDPINGTRRCGLRTVWLINYEYCSISNFHCYFIRSC